MEANNPHCEDEDVKSKELGKRTATSGNRSGVEDTNTSGEAMSGTNVTDTSRSVKPLPGNPMAALNILPSKSTEHGTASAQSQSHGAITESYKEKGEEPIPHEGYRFRKFLVDLSKQTTDTDLEQMKSLMKRAPGFEKSVLYDIKTPNVFYDRLEFTGHLNGDNMSVLRKLFTDMKNEKLLQIVRKYSSETDTDDQEDRDLATLQKELHYWYKQTLSSMRSFPWCDLFEVDLDHVFTNLEAVSGAKHKLSIGKGTERCETVEQLTDVLWSGERQSKSLVEGPPGCGKSTLCRRLAYMWAKNNNLIHNRRFDILLLIEARNLKYGLDDYIMNQLFPGDIGLDKGRIIDCLKRHEEDILFIIDGVDELNDSGKDMLLNFLNGRFLRRASVLLTGRPEATMTYSRFAEKHLRITGFTTENVKAYVNKFFHFDESLWDSRDKLLKKIEENEDLRALAVNPFTTVLLCSLAADSREIPSSQNEIIKQVILKTCEGYLLKTKSTLTLEDLLNAARYVAYKGQVAKIIVFEESDVKCWPASEEASALLQSGLLTRDLSISRLNPKQQCYFPHRTLQEFLCASYLSSLGGKEFKRVLMQFPCTAYHLHLFECLLEIVINEIPKMPVLLSHLRTGDSTDFARFVLQAAELATHPDVHKMLVAEIRRQIFLFCYLKMSNRTQPEVIRLVIQSLGLCPSTVLASGLDPSVTRSDMIEYLGNPHRYEDNPVFRSVADDVLRPASRVDTVKFAHAHELKAGILLLRQGTKIHLLSTVFKPGFVDKEGFVEFLSLLRNLDTEMRLFVAIPKPLFDDYLYLECLNRMIICNKSKVPVFHSFIPPFDQRVEWSRTDVMPLQLPGSVQELYYRKYCPY